MSDLLNLRDQFLLSQNSQYHHSMHDYPLKLNLERADLDEGGFTGMSLEIKTKVKI